MTNVEMTPNDQFQLLFNNVKNACKQDFNKLSSFYTEHSEIKKSVDDLYAFVKLRGFEKDFQFYSGKISNASGSFISDWKEYQKDWKDVIWDAKFQLLKLDDFFEDFEFKNPILSESSKKIDEYDFTALAPDLDDEDEFDPSTHNGGQAIDAAFESLWRTIELKHESEFTDAWVGNEAKIGFEALTYLQTQIGLDFHQVFRRWFLMPKILVPPKAQTKLSSGSVEFYSCYDQLNSAIRSFVFGSDLAAFSMCRATIEQVLRLYVPSKKEEKLFRIVTAADAKFEHIQKGKIQKFVSLGNKVLHDPSRLSKSAYEIEQTLLQYFKTIKFLLERYK